jgi:hypothetical protein
MRYSRNAHPGRSVFCQSDPIHALDDVRAAVRKSVRFRHAATKQGNRGHPMKRADSRTYHTVSSEASLSALAGKHSASNSGEYRLRFQSHGMLSAAHSRPSMLAMAFRGHLPCVNVHT